MNDHPDPFPYGVVAYVGIGIAVYIGLRVLFRRASMPLERVHIWWFSDWTVIAFWPIALLLSLVEYWHLKSKGKAARERAEALRRATPYSHLSMDELLVAQRTALDDIERVRETGKSSPS